MPPDTETAKKLLSEVWAEVLTEDNGDIDPAIDSLIESSSVSIRFCLPTQLLGKLTDAKLDVLCLQKGDGSVESMWDPRGFASKVVVPWVSENQNVLGTSADPYVSKPLRKPRLEADPGNVKNKNDWMSLFEILSEVETKNSEKFTRKRLLQTFRSIHRKLTESTFEYFVPERISLDQTERLVGMFLAEGSGGDRGLSVAAALFETFGKFFGLYSEVRRCTINASDRSTGLTADIECIDEKGSLKLAIEVKERNLTLTDVRSAILKARQSEIREFLFNSPKTNAAEHPEVNELIDRTWASGTNLYRLSIEELVHVGLTLTGEDGRKDFLRNVGDQMNKFNTQPANRQRWKQLLESI
jgi:hypothetical protein